MLAKQILEIMSPNVPGQDTRFVVISLNHSPSSSKVFLVFG